MKSLWLREKFELGLEKIVWLFRYPLLIGILIVQ